jgi:hypothetical protein
VIFFASIGLGFKLLAVVATVDAPKCFWACATTSVDSKVSQALKKEIVSGGRVEPGRIRPHFSHKKYQKSGGKNGSVAVSKGPLCGIKREARLYSL